MTHRSIIVRGGAVKCALILDGTGNVLAHGYGVTKLRAIGKAIAVIEARGELRSTEAEHYAFDGEWNIAATYRRDVFARLAVAA